MSDDILECRICFEQETLDDPFISPCRCKGTSKYVHKSCLTTWRNFNRHSSAWEKCMECGELYTLRYRYPMENTELYGSFKNPFSIYFIQYVMAVTIGSFIWLLDYHNDYLAIKMLNFNISLPEPSLLTFVKNDELSPQIFYFCYSMFLENIFFYSYFLYISRNNIIRKELYYSKMRYSIFFSIIFSMQFIMWYYLLVFNEQPIIFLNLISIASMSDPFVYYQLIKKHRRVIKYMNEEENEEEILSYEENPLHGYENILDEVELTNIIIG